MALIPRKTYPELTAASDVQDADLLATYRTPGPLKRLTASTLRTYMQTGVALSATLAASGGSALIGFLQAGTGAALRTVQDKSRKDIPITPFDFGAVGDATTDDTAALAAMVAYVNSLCDNITDPVSVGLRPKIYFPFNAAGFRTTAGLSINGWVDVIMDSPLLVVAAAGTPIIGIDLFNGYSSSPVSGIAPRHGHYKIDVRRVTQSDWSSENDIGLRSVGYVTKMEIARTSGFCIGFSVTACYGDIWLGDHRGHKASDIISRVDGSPGNDDQFTNQCHVWSGEFANDSANPGLARYGLRVSNAPGLSGVNTIMLVGQSYELNKAGAGAADCIPLVLSGDGNSIKVMGQRAEGCGSTFARVSGTWREVEIEVLNAELNYTYPTSLLLDDQTTGGGSVHLYRMGGASSPAFKPIFDTGPLASKVVQLTGGVITIQNMESATNVGAAPATQTFTYGNSGPSFDTTGHMTNTGPYYGVRVSLNGERCLGLTGIKKTASALTVRLMCFDSAGTQITATGAVTCEQSTITPNTGVYGGLYTVEVFPTNDAIRFDTVIGFAANVATVFVAISTPVKSWSILSQQGAATWFSSTSHLKDQFVGDAEPIALTNVNYVRGMKVARILPSDSAVTGWTLISGGNWRIDGWQGFESTLPTYTPTNVTTDRSYDADTVTLAELADVVGTLISDLQRQAIAQ